ncbi:MAG: 4Fe-4S dicluster domain-containing protein [Anaerolineae bacterium]|nr:4Fe-4S dicluster domain-containing protein [Anaerolineae bacterium]
MTKQDIFDKLLNYYEIMVGKIKNREALKNAIQNILSETDLHVYFLLPFSGHISLQQLEAKAKRAKITASTFQDALQKLHSEGFIYSYNLPEDGKRVYERTYSAFVAEHQVRKRKGSEQAKVFAEFWNDLAENASENLPTKTPYYRVLPIEATITESAGKIKLPIYVPIPDPRTVLPIDVISEIIKKEPLIAVAECYCRLAARERGKGCQHTTECCFMFNEAAQSLIESGVARQVTYEEAMQILYQCEEEGLVHNVDNCEGKIKALCNCCSCCCPVLDALQYHKKNIGAPSRFMVVYDEERCAHDFACVRVCPAFAVKVAGSARKVDYDSCIGCGLCVAACPEGALQMVLRPNPPKMARTNQELWTKLRNEAILGTIKRKLLGKKTA